MYIRTERTWYTTPKYQYWFRAILGWFSKKKNSEWDLDPPTSAGSILDISKYRYTCQRSISILGGIAILRYIEWINDLSDDTWAIYKYRVSNEISSIVWYDSWSLEPGTRGLYLEWKSTPYTQTILRIWGAFSRSPMPIYAVGIAQMPSINTPTIRVHTQRSTQEYKRHYARICVDSFAQFRLRTTAYRV